VYVQVGNADVLIPTTAMVGPDVIAAAPKLKLIAQPASGTDNIALDAAGARQVPVCTGIGMSSSRQKVQCGVKWRGGDIDH
jgi:phosphoglycerate dehydrogenase-like enzyme